jgi:uncharacterized phage-associated protein
MIVVFAILAVVALVAIVTVIASQRRRRAPRKAKIRARSVSAPQGLAIRKVATSYDRPDGTADARDVAAYIVRTLGPVTSMKLNRLIYLCQAASVASDGHLLFEDAIHATAAGPIPATIFGEHAGRDAIREVPNGRTAMLDKIGQRRIDDVLKRFGSFDEARLNQITCSGPWKTARNRVVNEDGEALIDPKDLGPWWKQISERVPAQA